MIRKIFQFLRNYPLLAGVILGLVLGTLFWFSISHKIGHWVWYATLVLGGMPILVETIKGMLKGQFASDIVASLAIVTAAMLDQAFAGAIVVLMQSGGEAIEAYGLRRASSSLKELLERAPRIARRKKGDQIEEIEVERVDRGDILIVRPGDLIPVDGTVLSGEAEIDESALTGEPFSKNKKEGDKLLSGSVDRNGALEMRADKRSEESQYAKIVLLVKRAQEEKAPIQRLADRYAIFFTPLTLFMCLVGFLITGEYATILSVLVVATPCPLILATPVAVISGINRAAEEGIIVKGGASIEQIASTQAALFDKTGTLTYGIPIVEEIVALNGSSKEKVLFFAACIEQLSTHSIAQSIVSRALKDNSYLPLPENFQETPGKGVEGSVEGHHYLIGSSHFIEERLNQKIMQKYESYVKKYYEKNNLLIFLARDHLFIGFIVMSDQIRTEAPTTINNMRAIGVKEIVMLTGDSKTNAEVIAKLCGINTYESELLPEDKVRIVQRYKKEYQHLIMVGDGINDAPALATATVGVAMGAKGTAISAESADIVLLVDDLSKVTVAIQIGKKMLRIAKQSIIIGIGLSFFLMCVAAFGVIIPAVGASLQEMIDVAVILNALRARK